MSQEKQLEQNYNYTVVRQFTLVTILWGIVGMGLSGVTNADALGYYQQAQQTKAEALHKGLDPRDKKR